LKVAFSTILLFLTLFSFFDCKAQTSVLQRKVNINLEKSSVKEILAEIEKDAQVLFNYQSSILPAGNRFSFAVNGTLKHALDLIYLKFSLKYSILGTNSIVLKKVTIKKNFTVSGYIEEQFTGEKVIDAYIYTKDFKYVTQSNDLGYFSISLPVKDSTKLIFSRIGFEKHHLTLDGSQDRRLLVLLKKEKFDAIKIKKHHKKWRVLRAGTTTVTVKETEDEPTLFGESDIIKSLQHYPGVQSVNEGISGIIVRGGTPDQNLVLLDGIPVYQASHLFGLFSIFNGDAIKKVSFTKSNFSVKNSSRLSSLIDVRTKDGNKEKFGGEGSVGLVSSKLMLEGPLIKDRTTFLFSGRRTYIDLLGAPILSLVSQDLKDFAASYYFYDLNGKVTHKLSKNNTLYLSSYHGVDRTRIKNSHKIKTSNNKTTEKDMQDLIWDNTLVSLKYSKYISKKWYGDAALVYSNYSIRNNSQYTYTQESSAGDIEDLVSYNYTTGIRDYLFFGNAEWRPSVSHKVKMGFANTIHRFNPGVTTIRTDLDNQYSESITGSRAELGSETRVYLEDDVKLNEEKYLSLGINYSLFGLEGKNYEGMQFQTSYRQSFGPAWIGHIAVGNTMQFLHFLPNSTLGLPTDIWLPSTKNIEPEKSMQYALGAEYRRDVFSLKMEIYYKDFENLLEYKDGANFLGSSSDWESKVASGNGEAYGFEARWAKEEGQTTGWVSYTLSWSTRSFEAINGGKAFPYRFDRRHDISAGINHTFTKKKSLGLTWVYGSGNPTTIPIARYSPYVGAHPSKDAYVYGERNNFRMRDFHRLDIVYSYRTFNKLGNGIWSFGLYNAYNRLNPFYIAAGVNGKDESTFYQVSILPILPSISYKFKF